LYLEVGVFPQLFLQSSSVLYLPVESCIHSELELQVYIEVGVFPQLFLQSSSVLYLPVESCIQDFEEVSHRNFWDLRNNMYTVIGSTINMITHNNINNEYCIVVIYIILIILIIL